jgi:hypothetical protein
MQPLLLPAKCHGSRHQFVRDFSLLPFTQKIVASGVTRTWFFFVTGVTEPLPKKKVWWQGESAHFGNRKVLPGKGHAETTFVGRKKGFQQQKACCLERG